LASFDFTAIVIEVSLQYFSPWVGVSRPVAWLANIPGP
jgi:hypothetical protein